MCEEHFNNLKHGSLWNNLFFFLSVHGKVMHKNVPFEESLDLMSVQ